MWDEYESVRQMTDCRNNLTNEQDNKTSHYDVHYLISLDHWLALAAWCISFPYPYICLHKVLSRIHLTCFFTVSDITFRLVSHILVQVTYINSCYVLLCSVLFVEELTTLLSSWRGSRFKESLLFPHVYNNTISWMDGWMDGWRRDDTRNKSIWSIDWSIVFQSSRSPPCSPWCSVISYFFVIEW